MFLLEASELRDAGLEWVYKKRKFEFRINLANRTMIGDDTMLGGVFCKAADLSQRSA